MVKNNLLKENERIDSLQRNGYSIIQNSTRFCFGMDAVLLTEFVNLKKGDRVIDLCTGTGVIPILLCAKSQAEHFEAVEIQEETADMAKRSVILNNLEDRIDVKCEDLNNLKSVFENASFDAVTVNPPYMIPGKALVNPDESKAIARHEIKCTLKDVLSESSRLLKNGGKLFMVHKPERLDEIIVAMKEVKLEPKRLRIVYPRIDSKPNMILIEGAKCVNAGMIVEKPLIIYDESGKYTREVAKIYESDDE
ncbi:MAG: tRNA1(Val) (adenine(37)-N6)-methyltransferase [Lachnospiraceae bacterium]|nr:tRNA1(Val) (adenine(37)-N6)-methyltransferase [Lachnospiraceae bacterium]